MAAVGKAIAVTFSYDQRKASVVVPAVWIVNAEDQPRGRQLLRDMGLLESTREELPSFLPSARHAATTSGFWVASVYVKLCWCC